MRQMHELMLDAIKEERQRLTSRRGFLSGSAKLAAGGAIALAGLPALGRLQAAAQTTFADDVEILNYALTLEHLENAFYRDGVPQFEFGVGPFDGEIGPRLTEIGAHEQAHVDTLTEVITSLGGTPVEEQTYDFGYTDAQTFLATASALENTGVSAYDGAAQFIQNPDLLNAAGTIVAVEARHAGYLNLLIGVLPFPAAFETPLTPDEVLAIAGPFIVAAGAAAPAPAGAPVDVVATPTT